LWGAGPTLQAAGRWWEGRAPQMVAAANPIADRNPLPEIDSWRASTEMATLAASLAPGTVLAMSEHGLVGARAPQAVIVDVLGLHDRTFALRGFDVAELWRRRPDVIWLPHPDHAQMIRDLLDSDELWRDYDLYPDAFVFGVALRREGPRRAQVRAAFARRWQAVYPDSRPEDHRGRR
jgi:hypothetical protein